MIIILFIILFLFVNILIFLPLKIKIIINLEYFEFSIYDIKIYKRKYNEIKDLNVERNNIEYLKIFKIIDIQSIDLEIGGFTDYYYRSINYGVIHCLFNLLSFIIKDQFKFNYFLDFKSEPKLNFKCIIKSNLGKIVIGLLKRRSKNARTSN